MVCAMREEVLTDRVVLLRPWRREDAAEIVACIDGDPDISIWLDQVPQPYRIGDALAYIGGLGESAFAVTDAESGRIVGSVGVRFNDAEDVGELGYWARSDARGRGLITRAVVLASRWAFARGAARVQLRADVENAASRRVAEKAGFTLEGVLRSAHWNERLGRRQDHALYSLLPGELP
jgi:RimJ/RimL family protein N-acetyltransferase